MSQEACSNCGKLFIPSRDQIAYAKKHQRKSKFACSMPCRSWIAKRVWIAQCAVTPKKPRYKKRLDQARACKVFRYCPSTGKLFWKIKVSDGVVINEEAGYLLKFPKSITAYWGVSIDGYMYRAHRVIWLIHYGYWPKHIDHIDHDGLNNRLENLREVTRFQNAQNLPLSKRNKTGFMNVCWNKEMKKYVVQMKPNNKYIHLGFFSSLPEAAKAAEEARIKYGYHPNHGK